LNNLKTIEEHNKERRELAEAKTHSGIMCPKCGKEVYYTGMAFMTFPARYQIKCTCGYTDSVL